MNQTILSISSRNAWIVLRARLLGNALESIDSQLIMHSDRGVPRVLEELATEAGVRPHVAGGGIGDPEDVTPHTLRHSVAYRIIQVGGGRLQDVQLRLRHANRQTTTKSIATLSLGNILVREGQQMNY